MTFTSTGIQFERGIWAETVRLYREKLLLILIITATFTAIEVFDQLRGDTSGGEVGVILWAFLAISVHASILNGSKSILPASGRVFTSFLWRSFVLSAPGIVGAVSVAVFLDIPKDLTIFVVMPAYGIISALVLSIAGTWLPAVVASGGDRSLQAAIGRGKLVFGYTLTRLCLGCGTSLTAAFGAVLGFSSICQSMGWDDNRVGAISPYYMVLIALFALIGGFAFVMLPVVLSRAYLLVEEKARLIGG
jgi:hypothetical protein